MYNSFSESITSDRLEPSGPGQQGNRMAGSLTSLPALKVPVWKRALDMVCIFLLLPLLLPVMLVIMVLIKVSSAGPVFFRQERIGFLGKRFMCLKFRTMTDARDEKGLPLADAERLTAFGKWLRSSSLDELPELLNVLRGEMSLVGPRPLLMQYLGRYSPEQARRHEAKPGITGWAQINGRNAISWEQKFEFDVWYVDHQSLWLDLKILFLTVKKVFSQSDINAPGQATMPEFMGSPAESRK